MNDGCLICESYEKHKKGTDFVCSACVQKFIGIKAKKILEVYEKAKETGNERKMKGLRMFVRP